METLAPNFLKLAVISKGLTNQIGPHKVPSVQGRRFLVPTHTHTHTHTLNEITFDARLTLFDALSTDAYAVKHLA